MGNLNACRVGMVLVVALLVVAGQAAAVSTARQPPVDLIGRWSCLGLVIEFKDDGTYSVERLFGTSRGEWKIKDGKLVIKYDFFGSKKSSIVEYEITGKLVSFRKSKDELSCPFPEHLPFARK